MPKRVEYDVLCIDTAITDIRINSLSLRAAAKKYGIPKSTLEFKLKHPGHKTTCGPSPILNGEEELELVNWIDELAQRGFPRKKEDILNSVQKFLIENPRPNPFKNNRPGECWFKSFLRRHPTIVQRTSEAVSAASACVSESNIRKWFEEIQTYLTSKGIEINNPSQVYNGDETGFQICPNTGKVYATKGMKNVYTVDKGSQKENITVMFSFSASGLSCPPMIIYPYKRIPEKISSTVNPTWGIGRSDNGWMTSDTFYDYIKNIFYPYLLHNNVAFPVILFLDGHKSHLTYELSKLCNELHIEIIALYPNATRILQPCDVAVFRPIKNGWKNAVRQFYINNPGEVLNKSSFAPLLEKVVTEVIKPETLINGFRACGLFPFNPDAIDFSKCLGKDTRPAKSAHSSLVTMDYKTFERFIGDGLKEKFITLDEVLENEKFNDEFLKLYKMWKFFTNNNLVEDGADNTQEVDIVEPENSNVTTQLNENLENYEVPDSQFEDDFPQCTDEDDDIPQCTTNEDDNLNKINIISNVLLKESTQVLAVPSTSKGISSYLEIPNTPCRKNKRKVEQFPFAITSRVYQEIHEKKRALKLEEEKKKIERKRKREAASAAKASSANKKINRVKMDDVRANTCFVCEKCMTKGYFLICSNCKKYFHRRCIPNTHKEHVPDEDDDDLFMCHICYKEESEGGEEEENSGDEKKECEDNRRIDEVEEREIDDLYNWYKEESVKYYNN